MVQRGRNSNYPDSIQTWRNGEEVPEWLSDRAKVVLVDMGSGKKMLKINPLSNGGIEIVSADGINTLVKTSGPNDHICFGSGKIFSLTEKQLELLYKEEKTQ